MDEERWSRNERLLRARLEVEIAAAQAFLEAEAGRLFPGFLGRLVNPMVRTLLHWVGHHEMARRSRLQLAAVLAAARDLETMPLEAVLVKHRAALVATEEIHARGNRAHPRFPELAARVESLWPDRVRVLHRFCTQGEGKDFEAVTRAAFPDRAELEGILLRQVRGTRESLAIIEREPAVARVPGFLQTPLFTLARNALTWYGAHLQTFLDEAYGPRPPA